jgi:hypothetical protein
MPRLKQTTYTDFSDLFATKFGELNWMDLSSHLDVAAELNPTEYPLRFPVPVGKSEAEFRNELDDQILGLKEDVKAYAVERLAALAPRYLNVDTLGLDVLKSGILESMQDLHDKIATDAPQPTEGSLEESLEIALKATCQELFNQPELLSLGRGR